MRTHLLALASLTLAACGGGEPAPPPEPACDLSVETLPGKTFVMLEATPAGDVENAQARIQFSKDGADLKAKYTVKSLANVYEYDCTPVDGRPEVKCTTEPEWTRACIALEVNEEGTCSKETLEEMLADGDDEAIAKAIEEAKKVIAEAKGGDNWNNFKLMNNNVANTLMGQVFAKVDAKRCRLSIDDMFVTIFNGKRTEDFNPVGTNPFVATDTDYLFEDCPQPRVLADLTTAEMPKSVAEIPPVREHSVSGDVHYFYVGNEVAKAEDGCTYKADVYANWKAVEKGVAVEPTEDGKLEWHVAHTWSADELIAVGGGKKGGVFEMTRYKTCGDKTEKIDTVCNAAVVNE